MPQNIKPIRGLQPGAKQATRREGARKGQHPRDDDKRREEISIRDHEKRTRTQDRELGKQQDRGDQIDHEQRRDIGRDEGVDPPQLDARERPGHDEKGDQQGEHDREGKPSLRPAGRQAREDEILFLWDNDGRLHHSSDPSRRLERAARSLYGFATVVTRCLSWTSRTIRLLSSAQPSYSQHVQAGVPVAHIHQPIRRHVEIAGHWRAGDVRPRIDQFRGRRRNPVGDFLRLRTDP